MWYTWSCTRPPTQSKSWLIGYLCCNVKLSKQVPSKLRKGSSKHISINWGFSQNIQSIIPGTFQYIALYFLYQTKTIWDFWPLTDDWNWQFSVIWLRTTTNRTFTEDFSYIQKIIASHIHRNRLYKVLSWTTHVYVFSCYFTFDLCQTHVRESWGNTAGETHQWGDSPSFLQAGNQFGMWGVGWQHGVGFQFEGLPKYTKGRGCLNIWRVA